MPNNEQEIIKENERKVNTRINTNQTVQIIDKPSTHFNERTCKIDMIVLHATATDTLEQTFYYLIEKEEQPRVSAHYVIDRDGTIYRLVDETKRAWHAGVSTWDTVSEDINSHSVGIEFQCPATGEQAFGEFTSAQIEAGMALCQDLMARYHIQPHNVVAHSDIAPGRKYDPGLTFPFEQFWRAGICDNPMRRPLNIRRK